MNLAGGGNTTLARTVIRQVLLFAMLAMTAQLASTIWRYSKVDHMADHLLQQEVADIAKGLAVKDGAVAFALPADLQSRYGRGSGGYLARVTLQSGDPLFSSCEPSCLDSRLPPDRHAALSWLQRVDEGFPISVTGGRSFRIADQMVSIDVAVIRDPDGRFWSVIAEELVEEMIVPTIVTITFALGATVLTIRRALAPVKAAAAQAERFDPSLPYKRVETAGMPIEIAQFAGAMDRACVRMRELMDAQKIFSAAISHEVRTPLAIVRLELEALDHPRATKAINEIDDLEILVEQLTSLSRLETAERTPFGLISLDDMLCEVVAGMAPWVYDRGATLALGRESGEVLVGDEGLLRGAVKNLIENAVKHGGSKVSVVVSGEPGPRISVVNSGELNNQGERAPFPAARKDGALGIGLEIVRRIAALHDAKLEVSRLYPNGVRSVMAFDQKAHS